MNQVLRILLPFLIALFQVITAALALGMIVAMYKFNRRYQSQAAVILRAQELYFLQQTLDHWQGRPIEK